MYPWLKFIVLVAVTTGGCVSPGTATSRPAGRPPTPTSVTKQEPGGDAENPEVAALARLVEQPFAVRNDRNDAFAIPLTDGPTWKRVRFLFLPAYTGFRYGDRHYGISALLLRDAPAGEALTSDACMHDFESWSRPLLRGAHGEVTDPDMLRIRWHGTSVAVRKRDGSIPWGAETKRYATVYGAYPLWNTHCGVLAFAFSMNEDPAIAQQVRDRFARDAFEQFEPLVPKKPKELSRV